MKQDERSVEEIIALEKRYWTAVKEKDADTTARLSADPCVIVGAQGVRTVDRAALAKMLATGAFELDSFDLQNIQVIWVRDDVAAVTYGVREDLRVEGQAVKMQAFDASVWEKRGGKWLCVLHTESPAGDPFGRR